MVLIDKAVVIPIIATMVAAETVGSLPRLADNIPSRDQIIVSDNEVYRTVFRDRVMITIVIAPVPVSNVAAVSTGSRNAK